MNNMNLLPEDLRPTRGRPACKSAAFWLLVGAALLVAVGYACLATEITALETRIEAGCARVETLASDRSLVAASDAAGAGAERQLIYAAVDQLDQCVPPDVALTGLRFFNDDEPFAVGAQAVPAPLLPMVEITGVSASGQAIGDFLGALRHSRPYAGVELNSLSRREDGEFAFAVLGRLSL